MTYRAYGIALMLVVAVIAYGGLDFYSYYAKAEESRLKGDYATALRYYREAIARRPEPGRNVRTYGINRLLTYYPYCGAAQCSFELGDYTACRELLDKAATYGVEPAQLIDDLRAKVEAITPFAAPPSSGSGQVGSVLDPSSTTPSTEPGGAQTQPALQPLRTTNQAGGQQGPPAATGTLLISSTPPGATLLVNGIPRGETPSRISGLRPGWYMINLRLDGYERFSDSVYVSGGVLSEKDVVLKEQVRTTLTPAAGLAPMEARPPVGPPGVAASGSEQIPSTRLTSSLRSYSHLWLTAVGAALVIFLTLFWLLPRYRLARGLPDPWPHAITASPTFPMSGTPPQAFGEYQILRPIGHGGMSNVFLAADQRSNRVALKILHRHLFETPTVRQRFVREADLGRTLHHPNIVAILGGGCVNDTPYIVMEYVEGETLKEKLQREKKLRPSDAIGIVLKVVEALDYAHLKGIIHRDLKPANILISKSGEVKVMDYGIARAITREGLTATGSFMGTPAYMAPETSSGQPVDHRADLYSVGIILFELLTGLTPFTSESPFALIEKHRKDIPPLLRGLEPRLPEQIETTVSKLLEKDPSRRYQSAEELINELRTIATQLSP